MTGATAFSRIRGIGYHVPEEKVESARLESGFDLPSIGMRKGSIERITGVKTRHLACAETLPSELAYEATLDAMARGLVKSEDLDVIVYAAVFRDYAEPATAHVIQAKLHADRALVFDISNACLSIMDGILLVDALIGTGRCRTGLVCGGELCSEVLRATYDKVRALKGADELLPYFPSLTLGDAGAAVVLEPRAPEEPGRGFLAFEFLSAGENYDLCVLPQAGQPMVTDGKRLLEVGARLAGVALERLLAKTGWRKDEIDLVVPHQISVRANAEVVRALGVDPAKCHLVIDRFGNTAATTLPLALAHAAQTGRLLPGMKVILAGLGSGVSVGFAAMVW
jgi:3-oxoacyl-[acyl-carrier-protein] synthase-3